MSTTARKARKRAGIPFTKPAKTPTPIEDRTETRKAGDRLLDRALRRLGAGATLDMARDAIDAEAKR